MESQNFPGSQFLDLANRGITAIAEHGLDCYLEKPPPTDKVRLNPNVMQGDLVLNGMLSLSPHVAVLWILADLNDWSLTDLHRDRPSTTDAFFTPPSPSRRLRPHQMAPVV
jgi:hypothetical protein